MRGRILKPAAVLVLAMASTLPSDAVVEILAGSTLREAPADGRQVVLEGVSQESNYHFLEPPVAPITFSIDGFVWTDGKVTRLRRVSLPGLPDPLVNQWFFLSGSFEPWPEGLVGLESCVPGKEPDFERWLQGEAEASELVRTRVRVKVTPLDADGAGSLDEPDDVMDAPMRVVEIVEREALSELWLAALKDIYSASQELADAMKEKGLPTRRRLLLESAGNLANALERARRARDGEPCVSWRVRAELTYASPCAHVLGRLGLGDFVSRVPTSAQLIEVYRTASDPKDFDTRLRSRWGTDAFELPVHRWVSDSVGNPSLVMTTARILAEADKLTFSTGQEQCIRESPDLPASSLEAEKLGLILGDLHELDRGQLVLESGVRVIQVLPDSLAQAAGLEPGDVIWHLWSNDTSVSTFDDQVRSARGSRFHRLCMEVVRNSETLNLVIELNE